MVYVTEPGTLRYIVYSTQFKTYDLRRVHMVYPGAVHVYATRRMFYGISVMGKCETAGTALIRPVRNHNTSAKFAFLQKCYQRPGEFWPYDPMHKLGEDDERRKWPDVIDRNQSETI